MLTANPLDIVAYERHRLCRVPFRWPLDVTCYVSVIDDDKADRQALKPEGTIRGVSWIEVNCSWIEVN